MTDNFKIIKVEDLSSLSTGLIIIAYRNGYRIEELSPHISNNTTNINSQLKLSENTWNPLTNEEIKKIKNLTDV